MDKIQLYHCLKEIVILVVILYEEIINISCVFFQSSGGNKKQSNWPSGTTVTLSRVLAANPPITGSYTVSYNGLTTDGKTVTFITFSIVQLICLLLIGHSQLHIFLMGFVTQMYSLRL